MCSFSEVAVTLEDLSQLSWAAHGEADAAGFRMASSAGALYPLEVHILVVAAVYARTTQKHRETLGPRYVHLEAGHAPEKLLLQAVAPDLAAVPIGAFVDDDVQQALALPAIREPP